jgi:hypothetical protein
MVVAIRPLEEQTSGTGATGKKNVPVEFSYSDQRSTLQILFQSFEELIQSILVRRSHGNEPHAQLASAVPTHRRPFDAERRLLTGDVEAQRDVHA